MMTINEENVLANAQKAAENLAERAEEDFIAAGSMLAKMMRDGKT